MVKNISIQKADNGGFILSYCIESKPMEKGSYSNSIMDHKTEAYDAADLGKAILKAAALLGGKTEEKEESEG